jgi:hypothetical protein
MGKMAPASSSSPFRYRDPIGGRWIRARYVATREEIAKRYAEWEILGPPEVRDVDPGERYFAPHRRVIGNRPCVRARELVAQRAHRGSGIVTNLRHIEEALAGLTDIELRALKIASNEAQQVLKRNRPNGGSRLAWGKARLRRLRSRKLHRIIECR